MKILITGGAGFIGSNLCDHFIAKNYNVVCLDNLSTGFKAKTILNCKPHYSAEDGFAKAWKWYFENCN